MCGRRAGELLSHNGLVVLTSDCGGVMEAASRGAKKTGGLLLAYYQNVSEIALVLKMGRRVIDLHT